MNCQHQMLDKRLMDSTFFHVDVLCLVEGKIKEGGE